jgi:hypothetical protein
MTRIFGQELGLAFDFRPQKAAARLDVRLPGVPENRVWV